MLAKIDAKSVAAAVSAPVPTSVTVVFAPVSPILVMVSGRNVPSVDVRPCSAKAFFSSVFTFVSLCEVPLTPEIVPDALAPVKPPITDLVNAVFRSSPVASAIASSSKLSSGNSLPAPAATRPVNFSKAFS